MKDRKVKDRVSLQIHWLHQPHLKKNSKLNSCVNNDTIEGENITYNCYITNFHRFIVYSTFLYNFIHFIYFILMGTCIQKFSSPFKAITLCLTIMYVTIVCKEMFICNKVGRLPVGLIGKTNKNCCKFHTVTAFRIFTYHLQPSHNDRFLTMYVFSTRIQKFNNFVLVF